MLHVEQSTMNEIKKCPLCNSEEIFSWREIKDYFLSKEKFQVMHCNACSFKFTSPQPSTEGISKYYKSSDYVSHSDSKRGLTNYIYHWVRKYTIRKKYKQINALANKGKILDVGCATGHLLNYFKKQNWETLGVEVDEEARSFAKTNFDLNVMDQHAINDIDHKSCNVITMFHVLEHVHDFKERMKSLFEILTDNGVMLVALPNYLAYDALYYQEHWAAWDLPRHLYHFNHENIDMLADQCNLTVVRKIPMKFDAYYVAMLSEKYKTGKINIIHAIRIGLISNRKARKTSNYSSIIYVMKKKLAI